MNMVKTADYYVCKQAHDLNNILAILAGNIKETKKRIPNSDEEKQKQ